jgi:hypothetical protein
MAVAWADFSHAFIRVICGIRGVFVLEASAWIKFTPFKHQGIHDALHWTKRGNPLIVKAVSPSAYREALPPAGPSPDW